VAHRNVSNAQAWHGAKNVLKAIQLGLFSDPPGVQLDSHMYIETKKQIFPYIAVLMGPTMQKVVYTKI
jgi:hypothetical protein